MRTERTPLPKSCFFLAEPKRRAVKVYHPKSGIRVETLNSADPPCLADYHQRVWANTGNIRAELGSNTSPVWSISASRFIECTPISLRRVIFEDLGSNLDVSVKRPLRRRVALGDRRSVRVRFGDRLWADARRSTPTGKSAGSGPKAGARATRNSVPEEARRARIRTEAMVPPAPILASARLCCL